MRLAALAAVRLALPLFERWSDPDLTFVTRLAPDVIDDEGNGATAEFCPV